MRDPRSPIPSPARDREYWDRGCPPPIADASASDRPSSYDPTRLLRPRRADALGLDRRDGPRERGTVRTLSGQGLVSASHRRVTAVLGLRTVQGWAIARTLSLAPNGVLLHHLDLLDAELDAPIRDLGRRALSALAPLLGAPLRPGRPQPSSPLATVGTCILARRVVADLAAWATPRETGPVSGNRPSNRGLTVGLVIPPLTRGPTAASSRQRVALVEGELVPLNDPDPQVLGVCLNPSRLRQLEFLLAQQARQTR